MLLKIFKKKISLQVAYFGNLLFLSWLKKSSENSKMRCSLFIILANSFKPLVYTQWLGASLDGSKNVLALYLKYLPSTIVLSPLNIFVYYVSQKHLSYSYEGLILNEWDNIPLVYYQNLMDTDIWRLFYNNPWLTSLLRVWCTWWKTGSTWTSVVQGSFTLWGIWTSVTKNEIRETDGILKGKVEG